MTGRLAALGAAVGLSLVLAACGADATRHGAHAAAPRRAGTSARSHRVPSAPLPIRSPPAPVTPFAASAAPGQGEWHPAGRRVAGRPVIYETRLVAPGASAPASLAWMDTRHLAARLYSGSVSPGGGPYRFTAPVRPAQARSLVAAFNGGFQMRAAHGGYFTEGRTVDPLRRGAASLVIDAGGSVAIGAWGQEVGMTGRVVAVRQNLVLLVDRGRPTAQARSADWRAWGSTCGARSCAHSVPGIEHQWRTALGVTADGALVYVQGPALSPLQLADLLARAGVTRGMELDINPDWPIFAAYDPPGADGLAAAADGRALSNTVRGPDTFFAAWWARDFITMSAPGTAGP